MPTPARVVRALPSTSRGYADRHASQDPESQMLLLKGSASKHAPATVLTELYVYVESACSWGRNIVCMFEQTLAWHKGEEDIGRLASRWEGPQERMFGRLQCDEPPCLSSTLAGLELPPRPAASFDFFTLACKGTLAARRGRASCYAAPSAAALLRTFRACTRMNNLGRLEARG